MKTPTAAFATAALAAAAFLALALPAARGQTILWDPSHAGSSTYPFGSGGTGTWNATTANWFNQDETTDVVWPNGDVAEFAGASGTVTLGANGLVTSFLLFQGSGYLLQDAAGTAYALTVSPAGGVVSNGGSGVATVNVPLTLGSNVYVRAYPGGTLALNGTLTTSQAFPLTLGQSGFGGTVSLAGNNSFGNGLNVTNGMLTAASNTALGTGSVSLAAGTTLTINAGVKLSNQTASTLTLANATTSLVNLAGTGVQDTVAALVVNGVAQPAGTYGAAGSGATFPLPDFQGTGELLVVPEPRTWACVAAGAGLLGLTLRRHRAA